MTFPEPVMTTTRTAGLELPEQIDLELQVANVGSRTLAMARQ